MGSRPPGTHFIFLIKIFPVAIAAQPGGTTLSQLSILLTGRASLEHTASPSLIMLKPIYLAAFVLGRVAVAVSATHWLAPDNGTMTTDSGIFPVSAEAHPL